MEFVYHNFQSNHIKFLKGGPEETMIRSCELKDTYLAGYLDDDRKLSFETAARAKLECNKGKKYLKEE